jgi:4-amino-4-deoxy-L-arabinose transferase-like glycosyltransferase
LNNWPSVWWDEGWTLDAARNWITHGHLGHYLDGQPVAARSPVRFPVVVPVALSMKILGVGIWQGRLPGVIFTILSLGLVVYLTSKIFNHRVGIATLIILLCFSASDFNPILNGRQVMAEMPMMFYLLGGYMMVWFALTRSTTWGLGAALLFGIAIHAKLQVLPFWLVSIVLAIWVTISYKQRHSTMILVGIALGSIAVAIFFLFIQNLVMPGSFEDPELIKILFNSVVMVPTWPVRKLALRNVIFFSLPQFLGFIWAGQQIIKSFSDGRFTDKNDLQVEKTNKEILRASLWGLGASWFVWYLAMAIFWSRYLFPAYFVGCVFFAAYAGELSAGFNLRLFVRRTSALLLGREVKLINIEAVILLIAFSVILGASGKTMLLTMLKSFPNPNSAANYLRNNIPDGARVETFESELLFLAPEIKYHFPTDLVSMQLVRKWDIDPQLSIKYDPLGANPDYLVVGGYARIWNLYDDVISQGWFQLAANVGGYQIYQIRTTPNIK